MPTETPRPLSRRLYSVVLSHSDVADSDLLRRFAASRDEEAFTEIVRRHGAMVLGVARRVTRHPHDAEDAFQAAFIVLARRASHIKKPELVANWLYGVAYRTALEARTAHRRVQEQSLSPAPEPAAPDRPDDTTDLRRVIDEELSQLPEKYRAAVVLCDLEGASRADAATKLRIPEGTLSSRLAHARKVLAERLTRRGVTASAGVITTLFGRESLATVPRTLVVATVHLASRGADTLVSTSPTVSSLADGVTKAMLASRLRLALGAVIASGFLGLSAYGVAQVPATSVPFDPAASSTPILPAPTDPESIAVASQQNESPNSEQKVVAKGIEDDDVPFPFTPTQAVARIEDGKLIVRQRGYQYETRSGRNSEGQPVTSHHRKSSVRAATYDPADVAVFDMKGNRLQTKAWKDKLKADVHVLIGADGRLPNPRELTLFKDDILIVVLPAVPPDVAVLEGTHGYAPALLPSTSPPAVRYGGGQNTPHPAPPRTTTPPATSPVPSRPATAPPPANSLPHLGIPFGTTPGRSNSPSVPN